MNNYLRQRHRREKRKAGVPARWDALADALGAAREAAQERAGDAQPPAGGQAAHEGKRTTLATR